MSINHFSTDLQETPWWEQHPQQLQQSMMETTQNSSNNSSSSATDPQQQQQFSSWSSPHHHQFYHHHQQHQHHLWLDSYNNNNNNNSHHNPTLSFNLNSQHDATEAHPMTNLNSNQEQELEKEPMFEKPLTPSDVGKLNRLVIPKQHAEKYFPLGGGGGGADLGSSSSDKGLLLSFEDESGKCWRFRYSYWNSSQSYVLTKGWSRYVKEKRLDAGDVILFERHRTDSERLFIGWRRRGATAVAQVAQAGGGCGWPRGLYPNHPYPVDHVAHGHGVSVPLYQHAGSGVQSQTTSVGNSRTLRLFGVNFECQVDDKSEGSESQAEAHGHQQFNYSVEAYDSNSTNRHNHVDITFSQEDVNQMRRNRQG